MGRAARLVLLHAAAAAPTHDREANALSSVRHVSPAPLPLSARCGAERELDSPAASGASDSQCLEASWRTGGAPAVAAQSPGVFRRACVSQTQIFYSTTRKARAERFRESGQEASRRRAEERIARRETLGIRRSPRHRRAAGEVPLRCPAPKRSRERRTRGSSGLPSSARTPRVQRAPERPVSVPERGRRPSRGTASRPR